ncbi:type I-C CRISPR-associated protein Cas8c/Csd1 [Streptococcus sp. S784/96/1]|uniref:type I-C CRISPR-associated protein Cas8c/Csd1 n=1 Tax=Streptococcus sp. S784/96/1 TaxID=2653499 RepID=UPI0013874A8A|nr:type I-C CRISPR-associated protein Cas8c/Csd1 [Streptococcus sp. S784/96/1]
MDFFTSLLKSYESAEQDGWVDNVKKSGNILLPIYHTSLRSTGKNVISVTLDKNGQVLSAEILEADVVIVFPVTSDSVARSGKNPAPHLLVDKFSYFVAAENQEQYDTYHKQLNQWIEACEAGNVREYLQLIQKAILQPDFSAKVINLLFDGDYHREGLVITQEVDGKGDKKTDLSAYFLEFSIVDFVGVKTVSVTHFKELHQAYIAYVESNQEDLITCNISGRKEVLATKHRGLIGNAKLISVSNNNEAYKGRFKVRDDVFTVGNQISEKIHLMAKYLLENEHTHAWLGGGQHLINWFSDDLANDSQLTVTEPYNSIFEEEDEDDVDTPKFTISERNKEIKASFIRGKKQFEDASSYYAAILNKTNDGRIALKYFRQLKASQLLERLDQWQASYSWERRRKDGKYYPYTPNMMEIILVAYGVDRGRFLELDNDNFKSDQFQKLVTCLIDGKPIPSSIVKKLEDNIKQRQKYPKRWYQVQQISLGILHKQHEEEFSPMLDHTNQERSYLFGRLLAIYELIESLRYKLDGSDSGRITNAERYWTAYTNQPTKLMMLLENKIKPYEETLKLNNHGSWSKLNKEKEEIMMFLNLLIDSEGMEKPLDYRFMFGYYAEKKFYYTKQTVDVVESED